jgi:hypothetical protein
MNGECPLFPGTFLIGSFQCPKWRSTSLIARFLQRPTLRSAFKLLSNLASEKITGLSLVYAMIVLYIFPQANSISPKFLYKSKSKRFNHLLFAVASLEMHNMRVMRIVAVNGTAVVQIPLNMFIWNIHNLSFIAYDPYCLHSYTTL